ncbi:Mu transposase C-terminal domain-containing protein [Brevibacterium aurantiacum]|uniref:Transposase n=1 Tax=Brevibacterium aurantiacum TaxID=273384 RepID=A0A1D7W3X5_BREAU|nr:Mu transposase C-terminal domain-containing protein [Brevibacterium aurantiacum]AOP53763.1 transposase [Brevibacterium aurantiacum]RCS99209.1 transposase [Brevibacterium aurantiacum]
MDGPEKWRILRLHVEDNIPLTTLTQNTGLGLRTLQRWHQQYKTGGIAALEPQTRHDSGSRRSHPELQAFIERLGLTRPRPSIATLHRLAAKEAHRLETSPPSYGTVRSILASLDPAMVTLALEGPAAYRDQHELIYRHTAERPNATWQTDHTELDILIKDASGRPERPWLTTVIDDYSRAICGYMVFTGAPSAMNTALALRQAIWRKDDPVWAMCGIPDVLHVDHGSDFTSHHLEYTATALKIRIIYSTIGRPQGRGKIERFFGTLNTELLSTMLGYTGHPGKKPSASMDLSALDQAIGDFITKYNERPHREIKTSPKTAWIGQGWLPRMPETLAQLDGLLLTVPRHRTVRRDGIHFQGQRYLSPTLAPLVGKPVTIRYDPRDISEIRVYERDTLICVAIDQTNPNQRLSLREVESARRARRRQLRKDINERIPRVANREEPQESNQPARRRSKLRTYEEDE